ncbi:hypothetical protein [Geothrix fermentans]|uniref:hypothetical protein n=1 Tax=Geothrix fermentans TaxID=44676 RepID=UPI0012FAAF0E|nr:hypothetical protein [Geothrix fermentans]
MVSSLISGLIGSIIGGLIAGFFSLRAVSNAEEADRKKRTEVDAKIILSLLQALHDELDSVFATYQERIGARVEALPEGQPLLFYYPVINDFFTVYNANAYLIGRIENNDLRKALVQTYVLAKGMVDSFRMNNELLSKFEHWHALAAETNNPVHKQNAKDRFSNLASYATQIRKGHIETKKSLSELMRMMHKHGVLHEA